jgi:hypothetical protein
MAMTVNKTKINSAGVFRCCLDGVTRLDPDLEVEPGHHVPCPHGEKCDGMTLTEDYKWVGAWIYERDHA